MGERLLQKCARDLLQGDTVILPGGARRTVAEKDYDTTQLIRSSDGLKAPLRIVYTTGEIVFTDPSERAQVIVRKGLFG